MSWADVVFGTSVWAVVFAVFFLRAGGRIHLSRYQVAELLAFVLLLVAWTLPVLLFGPGW